MEFSTIVTWEEYPFSVRAKKDEKETVYSVGDYIWYAERKPLVALKDDPKDDLKDDPKDDLKEEVQESDDVLITKFYGDEDEGPKGFSYLPWRKMENRWANVAYTLRGDMRFVICPPAGLRHCGIHITWSSIEKREPVDHPLFAKKVAALARRPNK